MGLAICYHWSMDPIDWIDDRLAQLQRDDLLRKLPPPLRAAGTIATVDGRPLINFASNDYLGLASDERVVSAAADVCRQQGVGRGASPLICGRAEVHARLESQLAQFEQTEAALLFPTGFAANAGTIPALADEDDAIYSDAKNHASIVDGCRLSRAASHIYPHGDVHALEQLLRGGDRFRRRLIVTDSLFSMDGDLAPLGELGDLAERHDAMLLVDEAHATGVFGEHGRGVIEHLAAEHPRLPRQVHVKIGTLSKALGAAGGFVCGRASLVDWLANRARTYVFSTAQPASSSAAALAALEIVASEPQRRRRLLKNASRLRHRLSNMGWDLGPSASQIIPIKIGSAAATMQLAADLHERGLWVGGIRPPSVPSDQSQLRIGLSAAHSDEMLETLVTALSELRPSHLADSPTVPADFSGFDDSVGQTDASDPRRT
jgi:8-amino-7-oxononanoate synthase